MSEDSSRSSLTRWRREQDSNPRSPLGGSPRIQPEVSFELLNFMELIGEAMGIHIPDLYKRLSLMGHAG